MKLFVLIVTSLWLSVGAQTALASCNERSDTIKHGRAVALAGPGSPWDQQWQQFKANVATDETLCMDYFTRGERRNEEQMFHDLLRNRAQIGGMSMTGLAVTFPEFSMMMAPFLFESVEEVDFVYDNYLFETANEIAAKKNLVILQWVEIGWANIYANTPIRTPEDMIGQKMRGSPNLAAQTFLEAVDADSIPLGSSDLVPALQTGLIEGGLASTVFHFFSTRAFASDFTLTRHAHDTGAIVVNKTWYETLTASQKETISTGWPPSDEARAGVRALVQIALSTLRQEGVVIHELDEEERAAWIAATQPLHQQMVDAIGGDAQQMYDAILAGKAAFAEMKAAEAAAMTEG